MGRPDDTGYSTVRDPDLQIVRQAVFDALDESEAERLISDGGLLNLDDALEQVQRLVEGGIVPDAPDPSVLR